MRYSNTLVGAGSLGALGAAYGALKPKDAENNSIANATLSQRLGSSVRAGSLSGILGAGIGSTLDYGSSKSNALDSLENLANTDAAHLNALRTKRATKVRDATDADETSDLYKELRKRRKDLGDFSYIGKLATFSNAADALQNEAKRKYRRMGKGALLGTGIGAATGVLGELAAPRPPEETGKERLNRVGVRAAVNGVIGGATGGLLGKTYNNNRIADIANEQNTVLQDEIVDDILS